MIFKIQIYTYLSFARMCCETFKKRENPFKKK